MRTRRRDALIATGAVSASVALVLVSLGGAKGATPAAAVPTWSVSQAATTAVARPTRIRIPRIAVDSALVDISVDAAGALIPPESAAVAGWFTQGPAPGAVGPAILAGHVDSRLGPGVFFRLKDLTVGDVVEIARADGTTVRFSVATVTRTAKTAFPTDIVYAPTPTPELRLITCGGRFDRSARSYQDNVIVDATLTA